jgi:hypothetical protein
MLRRSRPIAQHTRGGVEFLLTSAIERLPRPHPLETGPRLAPSALAAMDERNQELRLGIVRQKPVRDFELRQCPVEGARDPVIAESLCEVSFTQIGLQPQCFADLSVSALFQFVARAAKAVEQTEHRSEPDVGESEAWIQDYSLRIKRLCRLVVCDLEGRAVLELSTLQVEHVGVGVMSCGGPHINLFPRAQLCLERSGMSLASSPCKFIASTSRRS